MVVLNRCLLLTLILFAIQVSVARAESQLAVPAEGQYYHGVFPGSTTGFEDDVRLTGLQQYEKAAGKSVAWVYFSSEWGRDRKFPVETCRWINDSGAVPFIRLMLRSRYEDNVREETFTHERLLAGAFDADLTEWARGAKAFGGPLIVEFGTECNGYWFPWNGSWLATTQDGDRTEGPKRFVAMYRYIVDVMRQQGAENITWVFHIAVADDPEEQWNRFEAYYPGAAYVDWIGVSVYGAQSPLCTEEVTSFRSQFTPCYDRLQKMAADKPIIIAEFGCASGSPAVAQEEWVKAAFDNLLQNRWSKVIGFSWWNSRFANDDDPAHDTNFRVTDSPQLSAVFQNALQNDAVLGHPVLTTPE